MIVIGLMSGTSADGTDAAVVRLDGAPPALRWELLRHLHVPHPAQLRDDIFTAFDSKAATVGHLCALNFALGRQFARAALLAIQAAGLTPAQVDLVGSHGQTVWHIPNGPNASTLQLGEAAVIAEETGLPVVSNFRARDMAAGGQGAPLVAYVDQLLFRHATLTRALQNIGGIANVTFVAPRSPVSSLDSSQTGGWGLAFDTGPGSAPIDAAVRLTTQGAQTFDRDGAMAARGAIDERWLGFLLDMDYFKRPPPKTTGRELFGAPFVEGLWANHLRGTNLVATLTALTAHSITRAYRNFLPHSPDEVIVSGGGARNKSLLAMLRELLAPARVLIMDDLGLPSEAKEAVAFAILAYETWHNRPGNLPAATGARRPVVLGLLTPGSPVSSPQSSVLSHESLTESRNPLTTHIDTLSTLEMLRLINREDAAVAGAVAAQLPHIAAAVDAISDRMRAGGRLIYTGAGTSGRLGVLDAGECPPTFSTAPGQVVGIIAGGERALTHAVEGAEDSAEAGARDLAALDVGEHDCVVGLAASGRTPYVLGALAEANRRGAFTVSVASNHPSPLAELARVHISPLVGPEVIAGSTRLKAGTAQKLVLNMLSTAVMVRLGKTFGNLMVDVQPANAKLRERARRVVAEATGLTLDEAAQRLEACNGEVKAAIVASLLNLSADDARARLQAAQGVVRRALGAERNT